MRRATQAPAARRPAALRTAAEKFLRFWKKTGQRHFREEEEILLPAYARRMRLNRDAAVMRMLAEHASIRALVQQLEDSLEAGRPTKESANCLEELARTLHDHVRFEENEVFPRIETALAESDLMALGQRLADLHPKNSCEV